VQDAWDKAIAGIYTSGPSGSYSAGISSGIFVTSEIKRWLSGPDAYCAVSLWQEVVLRLRFPLNFSMTSFTLPIWENYGATGTVSMDGISINGVPYAIHDADPGDTIIDHRTVGDGDEFDLPIGNTFEDSGYVYSDVTFTYDYPETHPFDGMTIPYPYVGDVLRQRDVRAYATSPGATSQIPAAAINDFTYG
jgi:hypothetical protein